VLTVFHQDRGRTNDVIKVIKTFKLGFDVSKSLFDPIDIPNVNTIQRPREGACDSLVMINQIDYSFPNT